MAEQTPNLRALPKTEAYAALQEQVDAVLTGVGDAITAMATMSALLYHGFGFLWAGFYRVVADGELLRVGPYQGTMGCLEIAFGTGVCGTAARERRTVVVTDVHAFAGHIACDARSRSEIVVPVYDIHGALIAVLDIDSEFPSTFDAADVAGLEQLVSWFHRSTPA